MRVHNVALVSATWMKPSAVGVSTWTIAVIHKSESSNNNLTADLVTLLFYTKIIGTTINNCCENVIIIILIKDCSEKKDENKGVEEVCKD